MTGGRTGLKEMENVQLGEALTRSFEKVMYGTARFIVRKQCEDMGFNLETLTADQARKVVSKLDRILQDIYGKKIADNAVHEMRVVIARYDKKADRPAPVPAQENNKENKMGKKHDQYIFRMGE